MFEQYYVLVKKNDNAKTMAVKLQSFAYGSAEAEKAKQDEVELMTLAKNQGYTIICDNKVIYNCYHVDFDEVEDRLKGLSSEQLESRIEKFKEKEKLSIIKQTDLTKLTESEIILLAKSRVHGDHYTIQGHPALGIATTFEDEYRKIKETIKQKKNARLLEIKQKDLTELTDEEIVLLAQSRVDESLTTYVGAEGVSQKVTDVFDEYQKIVDEIKQKTDENKTFH